MPDTLSNSVQLFFLVDAVSESFKKVGRPDWSRVLIFLQEADGSEQQWALESSAVAETDPSIPDVLQ